MASFYFLLNDGTSNILLNDGTSQLLLNDEGAAPAPSGVIISGTHARPSLSLPRRRQEIPVEFTFWLKAGLLRIIATRYGLKSTLILDIREKTTKLASNLLRETNTILKINASTIQKIQETKIKIQSSILVKTKGIVNIIAETKNSKLKKVLLRKLKEMLDD